ncbi:MAG: hypothetical protein ACLPWS_17080 [Rhodomicrobium sp.]
MRLVRGMDDALTGLQQRTIRSLAIFEFLRYFALMTERTDDSMAFAMPTGEDIAAWSALSREEQLAPLRQECAHPDCDAVIDDSMAGILALAKERAAQKQHAGV